jgi:hypothetical protein
MQRRIRREVKLTIPRHKLNRLRFGTGLAIFAITRFTRIKKEGGRKALKELLKERTDSGKGRTGHVKNSDYCTLSTVVSVRLRLLSAH